MVKNDFSGSIRFITRDRPDIMKMLLLAALSRFFVMGVMLVGLPFLVRAVLGLDAKFYGGAESALAVSAILGSVAAGVLTGKLKSGRLSYVLAAIGICIIPAGAVYVFPSGPFVRYAVSVISFCSMQAAISIFSIFAVSMIQQNTPDDLIGKIMAYTCVIGLLAAGFFRRLEEKQGVNRGIKEI